MDMNILVTLDRNYLKPLSCLLQSLGEAQKQDTITVYVAHSALEQEDIAFLEAGVEQYDIHIQSIRVTEKWFSDTPVLERLPEESFYRIMAFSYLPESVSRCLYLDPDILIRKSLAPLYEMDMKDNLIAAASHMHGFWNYINKARLNLGEQERYINSGVMLMNLAAIRRVFTVPDILEALEENIGKLYLGDQDLINILFEGKTMLIDERIYNMDERTYRHNRKQFDMEQVKSQTVVIHYNGKYKPWLEGYKGKLAALYPEVPDKGPAPHGRVKAQAKAKAILNIIGASPKTKFAAIGVLLLIAVCIFCYIVFGKEVYALLSEPEKLREYINGFGFLDELIFILIRALQTVVKFIPAEPLEIASGYWWGSMMGMVYCLIGNMIGTLVILGLIRKFGPKIISWLIPSKNLKALALFDKAGKNYALFFFLYLIPGTPKDGLTYIVGLTDMKIMPYMIITGIARIPSILSSTLCGSALAERQYLLSLVIFGLTILMAAVGFVIYRKYSKDGFNSKK